MVDFRQQFKQQRIEQNEQEVLDAVNNANIKLDELRAKIIKCDTDGLLMAVDDVNEARNEGTKPADDVHDVDRERGQKLRDMLTDTQLEIINLSYEYNRRCKCEPR